MIIKHKTQIYDATCYGKPWIARVSSSGGEYTYDWGHWQGYRGKEGTLAVDCEIGDVLAKGQKNYRGEGSPTDYGYVSSDGLPHWGFSRPEAFALAKKVKAGVKGKPAPKTTPAPKVEPKAKVEPKTKKAPQGAIKVTKPKIKASSTGHYLLQRVLNLLSIGVPVYLWGPAGTGKTTMGFHAAQALGREAEIDTLDPSTFRSMIQGYCKPTGEPVHTSFTRCFGGGKTYVADETDNAPGHVQTLYNSALANGHAPFAWGNVAKHKNFHFVGTGNTPGRPTRAFPDRRPMSAAFADRLYFLHVPLDPRIEERACGLSESKPPEQVRVALTKEEWHAWVLKVRAYCETHAPTVQVTPRVTIQGLKCLAIGETPSQVADGLVFRGCDDELKNKILNACPLPGVVLR